MPSCWMYRAEPPHLHLFWSIVTREENLTIVLLDCFTLMPGLRLTKGQKREVRNDDLEYLHYMAASY